jgi:hypothetical protein
VLVLFCLFTHCIGLKDCSSFSNGARNAGNRVGSAASGLRWLSCLGEERHNLPPLWSPWRLCFESNFITRLMHSDSSMKPPSTVPARFLSVASSKSPAPPFLLLRLIHGDYGGMLRGGSREGGDMGGEGGKCGLPGTDSSVEVGQRRGRRHDSRVHEFRLFRFLSVFLRGCTGSG